LAYVAALTPDTWHVDVIDEYVEELDLARDADLVGISTYSVNATRGYELAEHFRSRGIPVVMGGIHASMVPDEALQYVDSVVVGECESVWAQVIADVESNCLKKVYHGERLPLNGLVQPRRDLLKGKYEMDVIQTTRGCPFSCEFCSVTAFNGAEFRMRPVEDVLNEMETLEKDIFYFIDDNLFGSGAIGRERALRLFHGMVDRGIKKIWFSQASINIARYPDVLDAAYRSGCRSLFIGLESPCEANLKTMNKSPNLAVGQDGVRKAIREIQKHHIAVVGAFIIGYDHDDVTVFARLLDLMDEVDSVQLAILTPFPGTALFERLHRENRIVYDDFPGDWEKSDTDHVMIRPLNLDIIELVRGFDYIIGKKFSWHSIIRQAIRTLIRTRSPLAAYMSYCFNSDSAKVNGKRKKADTGRA